MNLQRIVTTIACLGLILNVTAFSQEDLSVLPEKIDNVSPADMMGNYLHRLAGQKFETWKQQYEQRKTSEQIAEYQKCHTTADKIEQIHITSAATAVHSQT